MSGSPASREERVLRERAERFRRPAEARAADPGTDHLVFRNGGRTYALECSGVVEVCRPEAFLPLPGHAAIVKGVFLRRGGMVAVLDLPRFLGDAAEAAAQGEPACMLVLEAGGVRLGIEARDPVRKRIDISAVKPLSGSALRHLAGLAPDGEAVLLPGPVLLRKALEESAGASHGPLHPAPERLKDEP